jgi:arylsulfatase A-like enzyme
MAPYVYVRNDRFTAIPTLQQPAVKFPHFVRQGPRSEDFVIDLCLDRLVDEATTWIGRSFSRPEPCFLYLPLTAPHKPTQPKAEFRGKTGLSEYGDLVAQVDDAIGQVLEAIDSSGEAGNTLVVITSDNGSYMYRYDEPGHKDHTDDDSIQGYRAANHTANGPWRGTKADIYEAGHHVPFLVRWPGRIEAGSKLRPTICHVDLFATCAVVVGHDLGAHEGEDSFSWLDAAEGRSWSRPAPVIHQSGNGSLAIRDDRWKMVACSGSGGRQQPVGKPDDGVLRLFDMVNDPGESTDVSPSHPEVVEQLASALNQLRQMPGSRAWSSH